MTVAAQYITRLPEQKISQLTQLQWTVDYAHKEYLLAKMQTAAAWKMVDDAIENDNQEAIRDCRVLAEFCEGIQSMAWHEWDSAKARLLAQYQ